MKIGMNPGEAPVLDSEKLTSGEEKAVGHVVAIVDAYLSGSDVAINSSLEDFRLFINGGGLEVDEKEVDDALKFLKDVDEYGVSGVKSEVNQYLDSLLRLGQEFSNPQMQKIDAAVAKIESILAKSPQTLKGGEA